MSAYRRGDITLVHAEATEFLRELPAACVSLVATDPPWNTGGVRRGANGCAYEDALPVADYEALMTTFFEETFRVIEPSGTLAVWADYRFIPYLAVWGDRVWGAQRRVGEIIVESLLGNPGKARWPVKHSTILLFARTPDHQRFDHAALPDVPRRPGGAVRRESNGKAYSYGTEKKAASVLSATLSNTDPQRVGYPDQKPEWVYETLIRAFTLPGALVADPFAGSGTCGAACESTGRACLLADRSSQAIETVTKRLRLTEV